MSTPHHRFKEYAHLVIHEKFGKETIKICNNNLYVEPCDVSEVRHLALLARNLKKKGQPYIIASFDSMHNDIRNERKMAIFTKSSFEVVKTMELPMKDYSGVFSGQISLKR